MADPTLTGFRLLKALRIYSNSNTTRLKRYNRNMCIFSTATTTIESLLPPSKLVLPKDVLVIAHPAKRMKICTLAHWDLLKMIVNPVVTFRLLGHTRWWFCYLVGYHLPRLLLGVVPQSHGLTFASDALINSARAWLTWNLEWNQHIGIDAASCSGQRFEVSRKCTLITHLPEYSTIGTPSWTWGYYLAVEKRRNCC